MAPALVSSTQLRSRLVVLVSEGKTALKRYGFDDSDPLLVWMNEAMHQFEDAHDWSFLQQVTTLTVLAGINTLTLPTNFYKIHSIRDTVGKLKLGYMTISEFERVIETPDDLSLPELYTITGTQDVQLYPTPDTDRLMRVVYQEELDEMVSDGSVMSGPPRIHYPIVQGAVMIALQAENEEDRAANAKEQFEAAIERLWTKYNKTEDDEPQQVTDVMGYTRGT